MRIVIAPDSYKESLTAAQVGQSIRDGFAEVFPDATFDVKPMSDGGEGFMAILAREKGLAMREFPVHDPLGREIRASLAFDEVHSIAFLDFASACGLELVEDGLRNPWICSSRGAGELIKSALELGATHCVVGLGGSATIDGGAGLLQALGATCLDTDGKAILDGPIGLATLDVLDLSTMTTLLRGCSLTIATDVDNPLVGPSGAARTFGPQKGAHSTMIDDIEAALCRFADKVATRTGVDSRLSPATGAAGGAAFVLHSCLGATLTNGARLVAEQIRLAEAISQADLVITGEGMLDDQSFRGKVPMIVAAIALGLGKPVIAINGGLKAELAVLTASGVNAAFSSVNSISSREMAFLHASDNLRKVASNVAAVYALGRSHTECLLKGDL